MAKRVSRPGFQASIVWGLLPGWQRWVQLPGVKGSRAGEEMIDSRALGSARTAPCLYIPGSEGKARALPWGWRVMKKIFWPNLPSWTLPRGNRSQSKWPQRVVAGSGFPEPRGQAFLRNVRGPCSLTGIHFLPFSFLVSFCPPVWASSSQANAFVATFQIQHPDGSRSLPC